MRRPNRQIEVFDISLMAVVTKAMGAFLVMMLLLLPYYRSDPDFRTSTSALKSALGQAQQQLADLQKRLAGAAPTDDPAALRKLLDDAMKGLAQARAKVDTLTKQVDAMWSQLQQARDAAARSAAEAAQTKMALAQAQAKLADVQRQLAAAAALRAQLAQAQQAAAALQQQMAALQGQLAQARQQVASLQQQLAEANRRSSQDSGLSRQLQQAQQQVQQAQLRAGQMQSLLQGAGPQIKWREMVLYQFSPACPSDGLVLNVLDDAGPNTAGTAVLGGDAKAFLSRAEPETRVALLAPGAADDASAPVQFFMRESGKPSLYDFLMVEKTGPVPPGCTIALNVLTIGPAGESRASAPAVPILTGSTPTVAVVMASTSTGGMTLTAPTDADLAAFAKAWANVEQARAAPTPPVRPSPAPPSPQPHP